MCARRRTPASTDVEFSELVGDVLDELAGRVLGVIGEGARKPSVSIWTP
ncbi:hypothetical protein AB0I68_30510 [Streptomyces sp. NPDC050448]